MPAALSWTNRVGPSSTVSLGGAATTHEVDSAYPLTNVLDPDPTLQTRVNVVEDGTSSGQFLRVSWGTSLPVQVLGGFGLYLSSLANLVSVRLRAVNGGGVVGNGDEFGPGDLVPVPGETGLYDLTSVLGAPVNADAVDLLVTVAASASLTYGLGYAWAGPGLVVPAFSRGWSLRPISASAVERGDSGQPSSQNRSTRLAFSGAVEARSYEMAIGDSADPTAPSLLRMAQEAGLGSPIVCVPRSDDLHALQVLSMYGLLASPLPEPTHQGGPLYRASVRVEQIR